MLSTFQLTRIVILISILSIVFFLVPDIVIKIKIKVIKENKTNDAYTNKTSNALTLFCIVLTDYENINTNAKVVYETWANLCDNVKFVLKIPQTILQNDSVLNFANFNYAKNGPIEVNNILEPANINENSLTSKAYETFAYIYSKYAYYDWFLKVDDDTFIFVENLRKFLRDKDPKVGATYGYNFAPVVKHGYNSAGAGYVLSNEALKRLGKMINQDRSFCKNTGTEDIDVGECLRRMDVDIKNSTDEFGKERFHPLSLYDHYYGNFDDWLFDFSQNKPQKVLLHYVLCNNIPNIFFK